MPPFEDDKNKESLYIFPNGEIIKALALEKDDQLDLALLKIIEIYEYASSIISSGVCIISSI